MHGSFTVTIDEEKLRFRPEDLELLQNRPLALPSSAAKWEEENEKRDENIKAILRRNKALKKAENMSRAHTMMWNRNGGGNVIRLRIESLVHDINDGKLTLPDGFPQVVRKAIASIDFSLYFHIGMESERRRVGRYVLEEGEYYATAFVEWETAEKGRYNIYGCATSFDCFAELIDRIRKGTILPVDDWSAPQIEREDNAS